MVYLLAYLFLWPWTSVFCLSTFTSSGEIVTFSGVKFSPPISTAISSLGIEQSPSPIQAAAIPSICSGLSCTLHAATGSGKTFTYLLPMLKKMYAASRDSNKFTPMTAMIVVPTRELTEQVAHDIALFTQDTTLVHACLKKTYERKNRQPDPITAPIIIGTPHRLLDILRQTIGNPLFTNLEYLVLDEVDRLLQMESRYVSKTSPNYRSNNQNFDPMREIISILIKEKCKMQVIGASATVGRPLRREMYRLLSPLTFDASSEETVGTYGGQFPVIRPSELQAVDLGKQHEESGRRKKLYKLGLGDHNGSFRVDDGELHTRYVSIPPHIRHLIVVDGDDESSLAKRLSILQQQMKLAAAKTRKVLLFIPQTEDLTKAMSILKFWGLHDLHSITSARQGAPSTDGSGGSGIVEKTNEKGGDIVEENSPRVKMVVAPFSGTRGLHLPDIDTVLVSQPPKTMDEYLHIAGRTGRMQCSPVSIGANTAQRQLQQSPIVITVANYDEEKRMKSWQTALGISFDFAYV